MEMVAPRGLPREFHADVIFELGIAYREIVGKEGRGAGVLIAEALHARPITKALRSLVARLRLSPTSCIRFCNPVLSNVGELGIEQRIYTNADFAHIQTGRTL